MPTSEQREKMAKALRLNAVGPPGCQRGLLQPLRRTRGMTGTQASLVREREIDAIPETV